MTSQEKPIGQIELVGRVGYQIYSRVFYGNVEYRAKIGIPRIDNETGESYIIPYVVDHSTRDYEAAFAIVKPLLEELQNAAFREKSLKNAATTSSLQPSQEVGLAFEDESTQQLKLVNE